MAKQLLIIGAGMATAYLLQELAGYDCALDITVIGEEQDRCYNRVLLSSLLAGEVTEPELQMLEAGHSASVRFVAGTRAIRVDTEKQQVHCDNGSEHGYDLLVFATGSSVAVPNVAGVEASGVEVFRTLKDTRLLRQKNGDNKKAVVAGGGLLGLEAAHGLNQLGYDTTVVHRNPWPMNRQLDEEGGAQLRLALESQGIQFSLGTHINQVLSRDGAVTGILLDNQQQLDCQLLVIATGIKANSELAGKADLAIDRGILVDEQMRCSREGIFALGECCQFGSHGFGLVAPIRQQARVLAAQLMDQPGAGFAIEDWPTQLKISGIDIYRAGELDPEAEQLVLRDEERGIYRRLVIRNEQLIGAVLVGDKRSCTWYAELIKNRRNVASMRQGLMFGPEITNEQLSAAA